MMQLYPFMLYPGVVIGDPRLPEDQWSLLTPEGVHCEGRVLSRTGYVAQWTAGPGGAVCYEALNHDGEAPRAVNYRFSLVPGEDFVDLELAITNLDTQAWRGVMADICLMNVRAPHFYDEDYGRTFVLTQAGLSRVSDLMAAPLRPFFRRSGASEGSLHFYRDAGGFWTPSEAEVAGNVVMTQSVDGKWTTAFGWRDICMIACNCDTAHGCVHSNPCVGDILSGRRATAAGRIYVARQTPEELAARFATDMAQPRSTDPGE